jgi:hypothetical protein
MLNTTTDTTAGALEARLLADGFRPGAPPTLPPEALAVDRQTLRRARCEACRARGLACRPYHHPATGRYRVLAVCACGHAVEF